MGLPADVTGHRRWEPLFLTAGLILFSVIAAPLPAVNEPHYLTKAKHFWRPDWCAGDAFLESSNVHAVFYAVFGPLTDWLTLDQTAWVGRIVALSIVAIGWTQLGAALQLPEGTSILSAWIFLLLQSLGNWSGEWVVGGVEGKVFTYGFLFLAAAAWLRDRLILAGVLQGLAIAFHPVVGVWGLLAAAGAGLTQWWSVATISPAVADNRMLRQSIAAVALFGAALPGLLPALELLRTEVDPATKYAAAYIQVFHRLAHHLDPMRFHARAYIGYAVLVFVWLLAWRGQRDARSPQQCATAGRSWLHWTVGWAILFAVGGVLLGAGPRPPETMPWMDFRMRLMKFYPFRLADVLLPCAVAWMAAEFISRRVSSLSLRRAFAASIPIVACGLAWWGASTAQARSDQQPDWIDICRWFRSHTPPDVLVQTPHGQYTFKWYAERPEYVSFKDCPQDDAGIVEWNRRQLFLRKWYQQHFDDRLYSTEELRQLAQESGITHVVTDRLGPMEPLPTYQNATFRVYDLRSLGLAELSR